MNTRKWIVLAVVLVACAGIGTFWFMRQEEQRQEHSRQNLLELALALQGYARSNQGRLPAAAIYDKDGKPLLSWRVRVLPYLEQAHLYQQFKLDEPWDSPHNKPLLAEMPKVFAPVGKRAGEPHATFYQVVSGPGTAFDGGAGLLLAPATFPKGMAATYLIVEAAEAVPWTKPADPASTEALTHFNAAFADGSVRIIRK